MSHFPLESAITAVLPYRPYAVAVSRVAQVSSSFVRITFTGEHLEHFGTDGLDQRVKLILPLEGIGFSDFGLQAEPPVALTDWYGRWRELGEDERNPIRTYTVRATRPARREIDIDFVLHGDAGPASAWAARAVTGDEAWVVGPDGRSPESGVGIEWRPGSATHVLLAGDETAAPAITSILESLPEGVRGQAFIEVPHIDDAVPVHTRSDVQQRWLVRDGAATGEKLTASVRAWLSEHLLEVPTASSELSEVDIDAGILWEVPDDTARATGHDDFYAWFAGEASVIKELRRCAVRETGIDRSRVAFMGYWREGRAEG